MRTARQLQRHPRLADVVPVFRADRGTRRHGRGDRVQPRSGNGQETVEGGARGCAVAQTTSERGERKLTAGRKRGRSATARIRPGELGTANKPGCGKQKGQ